MISGGLDPTDGQGHPDRADGADRHRGDGGPGDRRDRVVPAGLSTDRARLRPSAPRLVSLSTEVPPRPGRPDACIRWPSTIHRDALSCAARSAEGKARCAPVRVGVPRPRRHQPPGGRPRGRTDRPRPTQDGGRGASSWDPHAGPRAATRDASRGAHDASRFHATPGASPRGRHDRRARGHPGRASYEPHRPPRRCPATPAQTSDAERHRPEPPSGARPKATAVRRPPARPEPGDAAAAAGAEAVEDAAASIPARPPSSDDDGPRGLRNGRRDTGATPTDPRTASADRRPAAPGPQARPPQARRRPHGRASHGCVIVPPGPARSPGATAAMTTGATRAIRTVSDDGQRLRGRRGHRRARRRRRRGGRGRRRPGQPGDAAGERRRRRGGGSGHPEPALGPARRRPARRGRRGSGPDRPGRPPAGPHPTRTGEGTRTRAPRTRRPAAERDADADGDTDDDEDEPKSGSSRPMTSRRTRPEGRPASRGRGPRPAAATSPARFAAGPTSGWSSPRSRSATRSPSWRAATWSSTTSPGPAPGRWSATSTSARVQNVLPGMEAAFLDIGRGRNGVLYAGEVNYDEEVEGGGKATRIEEALKSGQKVLVQVTKDPLGGKGARLTAQVSLPGRFVVFVPNQQVFGISRRLPEEERSRLRDILKPLRSGKNGIIARTAAEGATAEELEADLKRLEAEWEEVKKREKKAKPADRRLRGARAHRPRRPRRLHRGRVRGGRHRLPGRLREGHASTCGRWPPSWSRRSACTRARCR